MKCIQECVYIFLRVLVCCQLVYLKKDNLNSALIFRYFLSIRDGVVVQSDKTIQKWKTEGHKHFPWEENTHMSQVMAKRRSPRKSLHTLMVLTEKCITSFNTMFWGCYCVSGIVQDAKNIMVKITDKYPSPHRIYIPVEWWKWQFWKHVTAVTDSPHFLCSEHLAE